MTLTSLWNRAFLDERPSISLGLFRMALAIAVGCHAIPTLIPLADNYLPGTSFRTYNPSFFPIGFLNLVDHSPAWVVYAFAALFAVSWLAFLIGWRAQLSCILMTGSLYYFYARNALHIGTLSFDILLVTLFLMCITNYHGDAWSLDSLRRGDTTWYDRAHPYFIQRLLQLQLVWTFWYTACSKMTGQGNWLTDWPFYYLMHYPAEGVVRNFMGRAWLAQYPEICYWIGVSTIVFELTIPCLWLWRRTRIAAVCAGITFQVLLLYTLHVPTLFFFQFPAQMLLFIEPERLTGWIDARRRAAAIRPRPTLLFDGHCGFCQASLRRLVAFDLCGAIKPVDYHTVADLASLHPGLTPERCHGEIHLVEPDGRLTQGFFAYRRLSRAVPLLWWVVPLLYVPGMGLVGQAAYRWIAAHRYLFHRASTCTTNQCTI